MQYILENAGIFDVVMQGVPEEDSVAASNDRAARFLITQHLLSPVTEHLRSTTTAQALWSSIRADFEDSAAASIPDLFRALEVKCSDLKQAHEFAKKIRLIFAELGTKGFNFPEELQLQMPLKKTTARLVQACLIENQKSV